MPRRGVSLAIACTSAGALAYEILLIRLFAIAEWHHLAFLVISLALLGYGASGTFLALAREPLLARFELAAALGATAFGITSFGAVVVWQRLELNSLEIFWSSRELGKLFFLYFLFAVPFFCAATAIGLTLSRFASQAPGLYRADLLGGGLSAAALTVLLFYVHPVSALQIVSATGFIAAAIFALPRRAAMLPLLGIVAVVAARPLALPLRISQFKELSYALHMPGARVVEESSSPLGLLTVVASPAVPFRYAPGLSLSFTGEIPPQLGVFTDGGAMTPIITSQHLEYLDGLPTAVAYHAGTAKQSVAVIGAGGGSEVLSALAHGALRVTALEMNRRMVNLVRRSSGVYDEPRVRTVIAEGRRYLRESNERYDAIQIALIGSQSASAAGVQAVGENYLYTVESIRELVGHLRPGGYLIITRWMQSPPRDVIKLLATVAVALGSDAPRRVAVVRGWNTATVVVKDGTLGSAEVAALRRFCDDRSFDLDYAPGIAREQTNLYNVLDEPLFDAATAILGGGPSREDFVRRYKFNVRPATDERPYFFHTFRWKALPELLRLRARGGIPLLEWGYLVLVIGLVQALIAAAVIILGPLIAFRRRRGRARGLVAYFGSIGLAFLFIEIAFIQRLTLYTGNPLYAIAIALTAFLVFAGLGSGAAGRISNPRRAPLVAAVTAVVALLLVHSLGAVPDTARIAMTVAVIAPLAFAMGMPFPLGLRSIDPADVPWAWGINGTASVIASMLATLIAVHFGFSVLVLTAAGLYAVAGATARLTETEPGT